jgi:hypothetical protein
MAPEPQQNFRLGVLGMSDGNGHPYSWAAICNGYDAAQMALCPFPAIPEYLSRQQFPEDQLPGVQVTHVWTQDRAVSAHVAAAARIPHVVDQPSAMIPHVDGVLLARDDAETHVEMSLPFLEAGLPIYIDKPVALSLADLDRLYAAQRFEGQMFSCSALRYAPSLMLDEAAHAAVGPLRHIEGGVPKSWDKYAVHLIDPILAQSGRYGAECRVDARRVGDVHIATLAFEGLSVSLTCLGRLPGDIRIRYTGERGFADRVFTDTFVSFRTALSRFVEGARTRRVMTSRPELETVVRILEAGRDGH